MPSIRHPVTGAVVDVPPKVVAFWTGPGGWELDEPATAPRPAPRKPRKPRKPSTTRPDAQAPDTTSPAGEAPATHQHEES